MIPSNLATHVLLPSSLPLPPPLYQHYLVKVPILCLPQPFSEITRQLYSNQMSYQAIEKIQSSLQEQLLQAYELFDSRGKGSIDGNALIDGMKALGYEIDKRQVEQMIEYLDEGNKGVITKDAFLKFMTGRLDYRDEPQELRAAFEYYDQLGKGNMRLADLERVAEELGEEKEECRGMMRQADKDEDGTLNWEEFMRVVKKTSYF